MSKYQVRLDDHLFEIEIDALPEADTDVLARVDGQTIAIRIPGHYDTNQPPEWVVIGDRPYEVTFDRELKSVRAQGMLHHVEVRDLDALVSRAVSGDGRVKAPIPGVVTRVFVAPGQQVAPGDTLLILEAMKMENQIRAPRGGMVSTLNASLGRGVSLGELLVEIT